MSLPPSPTAAPPPAAAASGAREALPTLRRAASGTHTPFTTLVGIATAESSFRPDVRNARSSATGTFQITESTWLELVKRYGTAAGRGDLADRVGRDAEGRPTVADQHRAQVLDARGDLELSARLTAKLCDENRAGLARKLGRTPSESEVRLAHFLGLGGATKLIQAAAETPDVSVKMLLPRAFAHNRATLSDGGKPMTAAQAVALLEGRYARDNSRRQTRRAAAARHTRGPTRRDSPGRRPGQTRADAGSAGCERRRGAAGRPRQGAGLHVYGQRDPLHSLEK